MKRLRATRRRCQSRFDDLSIPAGTTVASVGDILAARRGRPLYIVPGRRRGGLCGAWISGKNADLIHVDRASSGLHRQHILAHELAHVALSHDEGEGVLSPEVAQHLFPDLDFSTVKAVLGRGSFTAEEEREAEVLAWLFTEQLELGPLELPTDETARALYDALGTPAT